MTASEKRRSKNQGMNWIRPVKRLAIYMRDGLSCAYCGQAIEDGVKLTLDHVIPVSAGGGNEETNLVTACLRCNSSRGARKMEAFCKSVAAYLNHGIQPKTIVAFIRKTTKRPLDIAAAQELIDRRGGFTAALYSE
jgi:hypothetical protein